VSLKRGKSANRAASDRFLRFERGFSNHVLGDPEFQFFLESVDQSPGVLNLPVLLQTKEETRHSDWLDAHISSDLPGFLFIKNHTVSTFFLRLDNAFGFALLEFRYQQEHICSIPDEASPEQPSAIQFVQLMPKFLLFVHLCLHASRHVHDVKKEGQLCGQLQVCNRPKGRAVNDRVAHLLLRDSRK
jgi:hypothetical protein